MELNFLYEPPYFLLSQLYSHKQDKGANTLKALFHTDSSTYRHPHFLY